MLVQLDGEHYEASLQAYVILLQRSQGIQVAVCRLRTFASAFAGTAL